MRIRIVGITGKQNSGKDTLASAFIENDFLKMAFADPLKDVIHRMFNIPKTVLWGPSENRDTHTRMILQTLGTDYARGIDPEVWIKRTTERIREVATRRRDPLERCVVPLGDKELRIVVPDVRFSNEAEALRNFAPDAVLIRVHRPGSEEGKAVETCTHISETEMDTIPSEMYKYDLQNVGTLEEFQTAARDVVRKVLAS